MILCLDIAFSNIGWVVFRNHKPVRDGCISTKKDSSIKLSNDNANRSAYIALEIEKICKRYRIQAGMGEIPHGGSQSSTAARAMGLATASASATFALLKIPIEWYDPRDVKIAFCNKPNATKEEMMERAVELYNGKMSKTGKGFSYQITKKVWNKGRFEHIADACGVYAAGRHNKLVKQFVERTRRRTK